MPRFCPPAKEDQIRAFYRTLFCAWGRQHWWPARARFEVIVGAFLTQNTSWSNVERALRNLRGARMLNPAGIRRVPLRRLETLVRPSGYFRQKARRLRMFIEFLDSHYGGSLNRLFARPTTELRQRLLELDGIGPETADSILLYAGNHPVFVVDAYTRRILDRHGILPPHANYELIRALFERALGSPEFVAESQRTSAGLEAGNRRLETPPGSCHSPSLMSTAKRTLTAQVFNEMHGLLVGVGKNYCLKAKPLCEQCPLASLLPATRRRELNAPGRSLR